MYYVLILLVFGWLCWQRSEIICHLAELLTERKDEILVANKMDMDLAISAGSSLYNIILVYVHVHFRQI